MCNQLSIDDMINKLATMLSDGEYVPRREFADSLVQQSLNGRTLSEKQLYWVERILQEANAGPAKPIDEDFSDVLDIFEAAKPKYPKLEVELSSTPLKLSLAGERSRYPGSINLTDGGPFGDNQFFGRLMVSGELELSAKGQKHRDEIVASLKAIQGDLAEFAAQHGRKTGRCIFCDLGLSDERSIATGYGKTCASNYGLSWGK